MSRTFTARWVFPVSGPPLERGTVTVEGDRVAAVEPRGVCSPDEDFGNAALIPGLVNAHTHLDLSGARGLIAPTDPDHFTDWLRGVIAYRRTRTPEQTQADIRAGLAECLRHGTTLIGDIAAEGTSWDALAAAPMRAVVFRELIGLSVARLNEAFQILALWQRAHPDSATCRAAFSPHAPYSAGVALIRLAASKSLPLTVHFAESPAEMELIHHRTGPFRFFLESLGIWEPDRIADSLRSVLWRTQKASHVLFAHGNYLPPGTQLKPHQSIVYCPRTHAAFGHPPHPFRQFLANKVRVCLGTDSLASNPDLDTLAEARFVRRLYPDFPGAQLLRMVTLSGAEALGWADDCGSLEPGKSADVVVVPLPDADAPDPHELLLVDHPGTRRTMFRGAWVTARAARSRP